MTVHGLLLAAGAGSRMGRPKALVSDDRGPWLVCGVETLLAGGCDAVTVVLGSGADAAEVLLADPSQIPAFSRRVGERSPGRPAVTVVRADDWATGMSASLRAGLTALEVTDAEVALLHLVDLPDVGPEVVRRLLADGAGHADLRRAAYSGVPGHPVLLGREHWAGVLATTTGDEGARGYLRAHPADLVECGDLATGRDVDHPAGHATDHGLDQPGANRLPG
ncbi:nucleotidyltransferase family protein [Nocardioides ferulae]|uniref:nucleotidyltransferase family protein n=1 Tax=Nocardioides ferulae TaxID=2340821 RepID=UPI000EB33D68|nr:nucleotidyltransferase family protein [Nocardioides ferulae]